MNEITAYYDKQQIIANSLKTISRFAIELIPHLLKSNDSRRFHRTAEYALRTGYNIELIHNDYSLKAVRSNPVPPAYSKSPKL